MPFSKRAALRFPPIRVVPFLCFCFFIVISAFVLFQDKETCLRDIGTILLMSPIMLEKSKRIMTIYIEWDDLRKVGSDTNEWEWSCCSSLLKPKFKNKMMMKLAFLYSHFKCFFYFLKSRRTLNMVSWMCLKLKKFGFIITKDGFDQLT